MSGVYTNINTWLRSWNRPVLLSCWMTRVIFFLLPSSLPAPLYLHFLCLCISSTKCHNYFSIFDWFFRAIIRLQFLRSSPNMYAITFNIQYSSHFHSNPPCQSVKLTQRNKNSECPNTYWLQLKHQRDQIIWLRLRDSNCSPQRWWGLRWKRAPEVSITQSMTHTDTDFASGCRWVWLQQQVIALVWSHHSAQTMSFWQLHQPHDHDTEKVWKERRRWNLFKLLREQIVQRNRSY